MIQGQKFVIQGQKFVIQGHFPFFALDHEFLALDHEFLPNSLLARGQKFVIKFVIQGQKFVIQGRKFVIQGRAQGQNPHSAAKQRRFLVWLPLTGAVLLQNGGFGLGSRIFGPGRPEGRKFVIQGGRNPTFCWQRPKIRDPRPFSIFRAGSRIFGLGSRKTGLGSRIFAEQLACNGGVWPWARPWITNYWPWAGL